MKDMKCESHYDLTYDWPPEDADLCSSKSDLLSLKILPLSSEFFD